MTADEPSDRAARADWAARADAAAKAVTGQFGHRLLGIPGTWLAGVELPRARPQLPWSEWHYWWQAHVLDCLVDAAIRERATLPHASGAEPPSFALARRLVHTIRLRNFGAFGNLFFDDMAWLALAAGRVDALSRDVRGAGFGAARRASDALCRRLSGGDTRELGGGMWWSAKRDYKNTAATGPAALCFARRAKDGDRRRAQALVDWLYAALFDPAQGLFLDGIHAHRGNRRQGKPDETASLNRDVWTYNQGPVLGALLELGDDDPDSALQAQGNLARAAQLIDAIDRGLAQDGILRSDGAAGDPALFRGILTRYLALAARDRRLPEDARGVARRLVLATADAAWTASAWRESSILSARLSAWMTLEAAWSASQTPPRSN
ncbi:glycoside hydrolase family 76 protein [Sinomonas sp. JGH33]|uniref:Glycoside hydrolase family 76 protein n=1 Tax=Sinomonas terricola TaxID=3110330 RepID=A0ABU5T5H8_9MICC|nr:glycoside hydrolase family 76 protein [Sinomonas sp. JGH33]MEA5454923.1 glycoside hydrolase family 76 protein [Sinomonas sp. JGH33]